MGHAAGRMGLPPTAAPAPWPAGRELLGEGHHGWAGGVLHSAARHGGPRPAARGCAARPGPPAVATQAQPCRASRARRNVPFHSTMLSTPASLPAPTPWSAVYSSDLIEAIVEVQRFQLMFNVFPFHEGRFRSSNRPDLALGEQRRPGAWRNQEPNQIQPVKRLVTTLLRGLSGVLWGTVWCGITPPCQRRHESLTLALQMTRDRTRSTRPRRKLRRPRLCGRASGACSTARRPAALLPRLPVPAGVCVWPWPWPETPPARPSCWPAGCPKPCTTSPTAASRCLACSPTCWHRCDWSRPRWRRCCAQRCCRSHATASSCCRLRPWVRELRLLEGGRPGNSPVWKSPTPGEALYWVWPLPALLCPLPCLCLACARSLTPCYARSPTHPAARPPLWPAQCCWWPPSGVVNLCAPRCWMSSSPRWCLTWGRARCCRATWPCRTTAGWPCRRSPRWWCRWCRCGP